MVKFIFRGRWFRQRWSLFGIGFLCVLFALAGSGCSPGLFFGGSEDSALTQSPSYRRINTHCAEMDLSRPELDVTTFRNLIHCFNGNHAMDPIENLMSGLEDSELEPLVQLANKNLLTNKKQLFKMEQTYNSLEQSGILDSALANLGELLKNEELVTSALALFSDGYSPDLLKAIEILSKKWSDQQVLQSLELGLTLSGAPAFQSIQKKLKGSSRSRRTVSFLANHVLAFLEETHVYECDKEKYPLIKEVLRGLRKDGSKDGYLIEAYNQALRNGNRDIRTEIPKITAVLNTSIGNSESSILTGLISSFRALHQPIQCMNEAKSIPDGARHFVRELVEKGSQKSTEYVLRENRLTLMSLGPFCEFPKKLQENYQPMVQLAKSGALEPMTDLLKDLYQIKRPWRGCSSESTDGEMRGLDEPTDYQPVINLMLDVLSDTGDSVDSPRQEGKGILHFLPLLWELNERDVWSDLLLLATSPDLEALTYAKDFLQILVEPQSELDGDSVAEVLIDALKKAKSSHLIQLLLSFNRFIETDTPVLEPSLMSLRDAYSVNDVHPFLDLIRNVTSEATQNALFFETVFKMANQTDFNDAVRLFSTMAKDGRLKELLETVIRLFHKFAQEGRTGVVIHEQRALPLKNLRWHNLTSGDLAAYKLNTETHKPYGKCDQLDLNFSFAATSDPLFRPQLEAFLDCQGTQPGHQDWIESIRFLNRVRTESDQPFLSFQIDLIKRFLTGSNGAAGQLTSTDFEYLTDRWLAKMASGDFDRLLDALPLAMGERGTSHAVFEPLMKVTAPVIHQARQDIHQLANFAARKLREAGFPQLLSDMKHYLDLNQDPAEPAANRELAENSPVIPFNEIWDSTFRERIKKWVEIKECGALPTSLSISAQSEWIERRVDEIIEEARSNVTTWDLVDNPVHGEPRKARQSWTVDEVKYWLEPLFAKMTNERVQSVPGKTVLTATINFLKYFTLPVGADPNVERQPDPRTGLVAQFHPEDFLKWLYPRAMDYRLITYFYPGETVPRVRLVNTLDMFELVLINVDFPAPVPVSVPGRPPKNLALDFLKELGEAWGDEPRWKWPRPIQEKFNQLGKRPATLLEAVEGIVNRKKVLENLNKLSFYAVGLPQFPSCYQPKKLDSKAIFGTDFPDPQSNSYLTAAGRLGFGHEMQAKLYNLLQVNRVLYENSPGSGVGYQNGLQVLRNLFYELYYSTPLQHRSATAGEANNLSVVLKSVRLGSLRQIGRQIQNFKQDDPALENFFKTLIQVSESPHLASALRTLLVTDRQHELVWALIEQTFRTLDEGTEASRRRMKQLGFYSLAMLPHIEGDGGVSNSGENQRVLDLFLRRASQVLKEDREFLKNQADLLGSVITSKMASSLVKSIFEDNDTDRVGRLRNLLVDFLSDPVDPTHSNRVKNAMNVVKSIYGNPESKSAWNLFLDRAETMRNSEAFKNLNLDEVVTPIFDFFQEKSEEETVRVLAKKLRFGLADLLESHDLDQILLAMGRNPDEFYTLLYNLSQNTVNQGGKRGNFKEFFDMMRQSLSESKH